ncbi:hypothetical protein F5Y17DRAFT_411209 [Xylariaceae sp. FL0594]|nr:hypothetical protein F5Y17DRAFT_411209 [Xylariaceae sp. FL0594]
MPSWLQKSGSRHKTTESSSYTNQLANGADTAPAYPYAAANSISNLNPGPRSIGTMKTLRPTGTTPDPNTYTKNTSTIRAVSSIDNFSDTSSSEPLSARNSGFASSVNSNVSGASSVSQPYQVSGQSASRLTRKSSSPVMTRSLNLSSPMSYIDATPKARENGTDNYLHVPETQQGDDGREGSPQWDSTIGKAGLGKTGRVINKLVTDNEVLKRDLKIERLKAEESKQAAKLVEDKMEKMISEYESRLLEANVAKTLLSRKERQVEQLQSAVELEKKRTADAQERERIWREEMETARREAKIKVEEATSHAALMEGRYNAISSHWRDQGEEVKRSMETMTGRIRSLVEERRKDDDKISVLRDLCDQQDGNIRDLQRQKEEISQKFEAYKRQQEEALREIKENARKREEEQQKTLDEAKQVLDKLKWALQVKRHTDWAD